MLQSTPGGFQVGDRKLLVGRRNDALIGPVAHLARGLRKRCDRLLGKINLLTGLDDGEVGLRGLRCNRLADRPERIGRGKIFLVRLLIARRCAPQRSISQEIFSDAP